MDAHRTLKWIVTVVITIGAANWPGSMCHGFTHIYGGQFNLQIPSFDEPEAHLGKGWMQDATVFIPDHFIIEDLDIAITINHTNVFDLQISLRHPAGTTCWLNSPDLGNVIMGPNYILTIFDDEAGTAIEQGTPPYTGRFTPMEGNTLSIFDGRDAFGTWRLRIYDWYYNDTGTLDSFEIIITTSTPEPTTIVILLLGTALANWIKPRKPQK